MKNIGSRRVSPRGVGYFALAACPVVAGAIAVAASRSSQSAGAATAPVGLGTASSYAVLAGSTVTNTGPSVISGNVGVSPGSAVTGFPPGIVNTASIHAADAEAARAQLDLTTAYNEASIARQRALTAKAPSAPPASSAGHSFLVCTTPRHLLMSAVH